MGINSRKGQNFISIDLVDLLKLVSFRNVTTTARNVALTNNIKDIRDRPFPVLKYYTIGTLSAPHFVPSLTIP